MFKLESFSNAVAARGAEVTFTQADLDQAYADGMTQARAAAEDTQTRILTDGLDRLAASLAADEQRRRQLRHEVVEALTPILHQVLDLMAPPLSSRRLEDALRTEMLHLAQRAAPLNARITCGAALRDMVQRCLTDAGLGGMEIATCPDNRITVTLQGGHIDFAPDSIADDIRSLIVEIQQEDGTWTH